MKNYYAILMTTNKKSWRTTKKNVDMWYADDPESGHCGISILVRDWRGTIQEILIDKKDLFKLLK